MEDFTPYSDAELQQLAIALADQQEGIKARRRLVRDEMHRRDELARAPKPAPVAAVGEAPANV